MKNRQNQTRKDSVNQLSFVVEQVTTRMKRILVHVVTGFFLHGFFLQVAVVAFFHPFSQNQGKAFLKVSVGKNWIHVNKTSYALTRPTPNDHAVQHGGKTTHRVTILRTLWSF